MEPREVIAREAFAEIAARFPALQIVEETDRTVEISLKDWCSARA